MLKTQFLNCPPFNLNKIFISKEECDAGIRGSGGDDGDGGNQWCNK